MKKIIVIIIILSISLLAVSCTGNMPGLENASFSEKWAIATNKNILIVNAGAPQTKVSRISGSKLIEIPLNNDGKFVISQDDRIVIDTYFPIENPSTREGKFDFELYINMSPALYNKMSVTTYDTSEITYDDENYRIVASMSVVIAKKSSLNLRFRLVIEDGTPRGLADCTLQVGDNVEDYWNGDGLRFANNNSNIISEHYNFEIV